MADLSSVSHAMPPPACAALPDPKPATLKVLVAGALNFGAVENDEPQMAEYGTRRNRKTGTRASMRFDSAYGWIMLRLNARRRSTHLCRASTQEAGIAWHSEYSV